MKKLPTVVVIVLMSLGLTGPVFADGVLVLGGAGRLGSAIVKQLVNAGESEIIVFVRPTTDRSRLEGLDVSYFVGDALVESDVEAAFKSKPFNVVINALSIPTELHADNKSFFTDSQRHMTKWAKETGVKRIILHSSIGVGDSKALRRNPLPAGHADIHFDKEAAEEVVISSGLKYVIIRSGGLRFEPTLVSGKSYLTEDHTKTGLIGRADLGVLTVYCLDGYLCKNKNFHAIEGS
jgi:uncharacterized protein YbjT (DUF2867 family)